MIDLIGTNSYFLDQLQSLQKMQLISTDHISVHSEQTELSAEVRSAQDKTTQNTFEFFTDFAKLYQYADRSEKITIFIGVIIGIATGISHPIFIDLWCKQLELTMNNETDLESHLGQFQKFLYYFIILGGAVLLLNAVVFMIWKYISRTISSKIRIKYLKHFIHQPVDNIEKINGYEWANNFKMHTLNIEKSIGDKVALLLNLVGIVASGFIASVAIRWTLSLLILTLVPFGIVVLAWFIYIQIKKKEIKIKANKEAQEKSLETTTMIKTVKMMNAESKEAGDYVNRLEKGEEELKQLNWKLGVSTGLFYLIQYLFFGVGSIMGIQCVYSTSMCPISITGSRYEISQYLEVFFQLFFCTFNFLQLGSNYNAIKSAISSSKEIYRFIDENPIVMEAQSSIKPDRLKNIIIRNAIFSYPLHRERRILNRLNIQFLQHKFNAIVGTTGCGKSTIIQLLLKQYQLAEGSITVGDGANLNDVSTAYWLDRIGIVTQQPVLFTGTVRQNVLVGKKDASDEEVNQALKQANIYEFISKKPQGLDFQIGVGGSKLSGGQKQRIAIARALVKKPLLLILDEATSALDRKTERQIQETIEDIRKNLETPLTIICIAHRLKTIQSADVIFLIKDGVVAEAGTFDKISYFGFQAQPQQLHNSEVVQNNFHEENLIKFEQQQKKMNKIESTVRPSENDQVTNQKPAFYEIYLKLYSYTTYKYWYIGCLFLSLVIGTSHAVSGILLTYSLDQMNRLYLLGINTNWCQMFKISLPFVDYHYDACIAQQDTYFNQSQKYLFGLVGFAIFQFFPYYLQITMLSKIENQISFNLRKDLYKKLLSLEVKYFDLPENESGGAASRFGNDSRTACQLLTTYLPVLLSNFCTVAVAVIICFSQDWMFGFLSILVTTSIAAAFYIAMLFIGGYEDSSLQKLHEAEQIANELIVSIKTALVLNYQGRLLEKYKKIANEQLLDTLKVGAKIGVNYGSAYCILEIVVGLALYLSIVIHINYPEITPLKMVMFMIVSVLSGFITGNNFYFIAHISVGKEAGARIMQLDRAQTEWQLQSSNKLSIRRNFLTKDDVRGKIQFKNVSFSYKKKTMELDRKFTDNGTMELNKSINDSSTLKNDKTERKIKSSGGKDNSKEQEQEDHLLDRLVLNKVSLTIQAGKKVAFVGPSGCGKSTLLQLLLRFYEFEGQILLDGRNIFEYGLNQYRDCFAMLNQQPSLFAGSIEENIKYNKNVDKQRLDQLCERACAYASNASSLEVRMKEFRNRIVGSKGSNISGGEKQRVACARALAREANIFLMDEGTSALDIQTQKLVLKGIEQELRRKTMINVAHRIETIKNSDIIFVFDEGELKQFGSYKDLMANKSYFFNLVNGNNFQNLH